jgi:hypothetical protein
MGARLALARLALDEHAVLGAGPGQDVDQTVGALVAKPISPGS